jgi:hypothetical protein
MFLNLVPQTTYMRKLADELMVSERCATIEIIVTLRGVVFQHSGGALNNIKGDFSYIFYVRY